jgi:hypothetical protein
MHAAEAQAHLLNGAEANVQHVVVWQHVSDTIAGQQHQPVCGVQCLRVDKRLGADERLRGFERKVTKCPATHKGNSKEQVTQSRHATATKLPLWTASTPAQLRVHVQLSHKHAGVQ